MAVENWWEEPRENYPGWYDGGGPPVGDPVDYTVTPPAAAAPTPAPTAPPPGGTTPPPGARVGGPGGMDPNVKPDWPAGDGMVWKFDPANGWYPSRTDIVTTEGPTNGDGTTTGSGQFDYGRAPGLLPFSPYSQMAPFAYSGGPLTVEPFSETFAPSSWEDAEKEPGFAESQARLAKMIQNTAAYRGILRSGATIGDLGSYLDQNKSQNFQQFDARNFRNFNARRDTWAANAGVKADTWSRNVGNEQFGYGQAANENDRKNNYTFNTEKSSFDDLLSRWTTLVNSATTLARPV